MRNLCGIFGLTAEFFYDRTPCGPASRPACLEVESPGHGIDVEDFARKIEVFDDFRFHRYGINERSVDSSGGNEFFSGTGSDQSYGNSSRKKPAHRLALFARDGGAFFPGIHARERYHGVGEAFWKEHGEDVFPFLRAVL